MSTNTMTNQNIAHAEHGHHDAGGTKVFGFWLYIMSDLILFACLFATYVVLVMELLAVQLVKISSV